MVDDLSVTGPVERLAACGGGSCDLRLFSEIACATDGVFAVESGVARRDPDDPITRVLPTGTLVM